MKRVLVLCTLLACAAVAAGSAGADGCPPSTCGTVSTPVPDSSLLAIRPNGQAGALVAYDLRRRRTAFTLPAGTASADTRRYYTLTNGPFETWLARYDGRTGHAAGSFFLRGRYWLAALSPNGRWLALRPFPEPRGSARFVLVDGLRGRVVRTVTLRGQFDVEAVAPDASRVYVIQYFAPRGGYPRYGVRAYDLRSSRLLGAPVVADEGRMQGFAWGAVASPDGRWLLTLYVDPVRSRSFVHALDLRRGHAVCIDLPGKTTDTATLDQYTFVPRPDGRALVAANPALGLVAEIDLVRPRLARVVRFPKVTVPSTTIAGAASADGRLAAFVQGRRVFVYDAAAGKVRGPWQAPFSIRGTAFAPGGRALVAVQPNGRSFRVRL